MCKEANMKTRLRVVEIDSAAKNYEMLLEQITSIEGGCFKRLAFGKDDIRLSDHVICCMNGKEVAGYILTQNWFSDDEIYIGSLAVRTKFRNRGIAKKLLKHAMTTSPSAKKLLLHVSKANTKATNLYKSVGFKLVQDIKDYYGDNVPASYLELNIGAS